MPFGLGKMLVNLRLSIVRRRRSILIAFVISLMASGLWILSERPIYRAACSIQIFENRTASALKRGMAFQASPESLRTRAQQMQGYRILERVLRELGWIKPNARPEEVGHAILLLQDHLEAHVVEGTNIILVEVWQRNPQRARDLANRVAVVTTDELLKSSRLELEASKTLIGRELDEAGRSLTDAQERFKKAQVTQDPALDRLKQELDLVQKTYLELREKLEEAKITQAGLIPEAAVMELASVPNIPVGLHRGIQFGIAGIASLLLAFSCGLLLETLDTSCRTIEDLESSAKLPVLGAVPYVPLSHPERLRTLKGLQRDAEARRQRLLFNAPSGEPWAESLRIIEANIRGGGPPSALKGQVLLVTSTRPEEGKSLVALNLVLTMACEGAKILLIDADLRKPVLHEVLGVGRSPGLTELLLGSVSMENSIRNITDVIGTPGFATALKTPGIDRAFFLTAGVAIANAPELLGSTALDGLLSKLKSSYDVILIDSPPILSVAEPMLLARHVDQVLLVYGSGKTPQAALVRAKSQLESVGAHLRGIILCTSTPGQVAPESYYRYYRSTPSASS